ARPQFLSHFMRCGRELCVEQRSEPLAGKSGDAEVFEPMQRRPLHRNNEIKPGACRLLVVTQGRVVEPSLKPNSRTPTDVQNRNLPAEVGQNLGGNHRDQENGDQCEREASDEHFRTLVLIRGRCNIAWMRNTDGRKYWLPRQCGAMLDSRAVILRKWPDHVCAVYSDALVVDADGASTGRSSASTAKRPSPRKSNFLDFIARRVAWIGAARNCAKPHTKHATRICESDARNGFRVAGRLHPRRLE